jgi:Abnormal spindle-like microcephaly-assoc'd, ASPM-SPD-2-Hydin/Beta-propeller repeat
MAKREFSQLDSSLKAGRTAIAAGTSILALMAIILSMPAICSAAGPEGATASASPRVDATSKAKVKADYARLPLSFEQNSGQVPAHREVKYLSRGDGYTLYLTASGAVLGLRQPGSTRTQTSPPAILRMSLVKGNPAARMSALDEQPGKSNYFIGKDTSKWRTGVPHYGRVAAHDVYPGVDLVYHGNQGQLEYDFEVAPGASPRAIRLALEGAQSTRIDAAGNLAVSVQGGDLLFHAPVAYQELGGQRRIVPSRYVVRKNQVEFRLARYDTSRPLVIDPTLAYSTYLGGSSIDGANAIAIAPDDTAFITGGTFSTDFPVVHPVLPFGGDEDAFVAKISSDGATLLYATYLGGTNQDYGTGIAVDTFGDAYITGATDSPNFPVTPLVFNTLCGSDGECGATYNVPGYIVFNGFVTELNPAGSSIVYSSYIGGYQQTQGLAIAIDSAHDAYIAGEIGPPIVPQQNGPAYYFGVHGGFQSTIGGAGDAFVLKVDATASDALYSTYLGGQDEDIGLGIYPDAGENAYVTGLTYSSQTETPPFPITGNALQSTYGGGGDAFLVKINTQATGAASLLYSSYFGGSSLDQGNGIVVDSSNNAYVTGTTTSTASTLGFTVPAGAYQPNCALDTLGLCEGDAFIAKFNPTQSGSASLLYFTYFGGTGAEAGYGIALDPSNNVYLTGSTVSSNLPVTPDVFQSQYGGGDADAFVAELTLAGKGTADLDYSSYLGGSNTDIGYGIGVDISGNAYVAGQTCSQDFPVADALQPAPGGNCDAFVSKISTLPGITLSPSGLSFPTENLGATSQPQTISVTNIGTSAVTISGITISGEFAETNTCGDSLAADATCTITVTFTPTANGVQKGTITLTDSAPGSPQTINLTGSTASVTITNTSGAAISSLAFGNQAVGVASAPQSVVVTNVGTTALTISSVTLSGSFAESTTDNGDCVKAPLQPTTNCVIAVTFNPVVAGSSIGALTVNDTAAGSPQVLLLTGTGLAEPSVSLSPTSLAFASQVVNTTSAAQVVTLTNTGTANLTVTGVSTSAGFAQTNTCGTAVAPAGICTVSVTFTPTAGGGALGTLTITDNAANSPQTVSLTGTGAAAPIVTLTPGSLTFSSQDLGTTSSPQVITLKNTGGAALTISGITASGEFAETNTCGSSVGAGASCAVSVTFAPTSSGSQNGSVTITDNAANSPQTVLLAGTGVAAPAVTLSVASLNFSPQPEGTTSTAQTVTVTNSGTATLTISGITITGAFSQTNSCGTSLAPQGTCVITVAFVPTAVGTATGQVKLTDNAPNSPQTVSLGGAGSNFAVATTPTSTTIVAGTSAAFTVTVTPSFGFNAAVTFACTGAPAQSTCTASPNAVTPSGSGTITTTLTIATTARTMTPPAKGPWPRLPGLRGLPVVWSLTLMSILAMAGVWAGRRRKLARVILPLALLAMLAVVSCGGGSGYVNPTGTPAGNYTVTVTGTSGSLSHASIINLTVQ